ncbi:MAG TPA: extracellular solute-binding protein [Candidatus Limnocylindrales bacterium]|nr:extracellular solute-binding protein [Candidatus Limnocylindrales bacterium]
MPSSARVRTWRLGVTTLAIGAAVIACAPDPELSRADPVTVAHLEWQPARAAVVAELIPAFEADAAGRGNPIRIRLEELDLADAAFRDVLERRYVAGRGPDVTSFPTAWAPDLAAANHLLDLRARVDGWPDWGTHVYPVLRDRARQVDGSVVGIPRGATVIQLFYRRDVLEAFGVATEQPRTWTELLDRMRTLRDAMGVPPLLIPAGTNWEGGTFDEGFINLLLGTGSALYDDAAGRWVVRSPGLTSVFRFYETLVHERLIPVAPLLEPEPWEPTKYQTFVDGDLAVVTQGTWGWTFDWGPNGRRPIPQLEERVGTWAFPVERTGEPFVWAAEPWVWSIARTSGQPDAAWDWIQWLTTGEALARDLVAVGNVAPRDDIREVSPYADQPVLLRDEERLAIGRSFRPQVGFDAVRAAVATATQGILLGELSSDEAAEQFARDVTRALGRAAVTDAAES